MKNLLNKINPKNSISNSVSFVLFVASAFLLFHSMFSFNNYPFEIEFKASTFTLSLFVFSLSIYNMFIKGESNAQETKNPFFELKRDIASIEQNISEIEKENIFSQEEIERLKDGVNILRTKTALMTMTKVLQK